MNPNTRPDLHPGPKLLKVHVDLTITVDVDDYRLNYGVDDIATIRTDVKLAALSAVGPGGGMLANGIADAKLND